MNLSKRKMFFIMVCVVLAAGATAAIILCNGISAETSPEAKLDAAKSDLLNTIEHALGMVTEDDVGYASFITDLDKREFHIKSKTSLEMLYEIVSESVFAYPDSDIESAPLDPRNFYYIYIGDAEKRAVFSNTSATAYYLGSSEAVNMGMYNTRWTEFYQEVVLNSEWLALLDELVNASIYEAKNAIDNNYDGHNNSGLTIRNYDDAVEFRRIITDAIALNKVIDTENIKTDFYVELYYYSCSFNIGNEVLWYYGNYILAPGLLDFYNKVMVN